MKTNDDQDTLYYDGSCPLCRMEIGHLRERADASLALVDVHELDLSESERDRYLKVLHLKTATGGLQLGLDANVAAWQHTSWGFLFRWLRWPVIRQVADFVYSRWAARRFRHRYGRERGQASG